MNKKTLTRIPSYKIAAAVHDYRMSRSKSLYEMQECTGIHRFILYAIEHNRIEPSASDIYFICKSYGVSIDDFFGCAQRISEPSLSDPQLNAQLLASHKESTHQNTTSSKEDHLICEILSPILCDPDRKKTMIREEDKI